MTDTKTPMEKLETVRVELVTLKPRLPDPYAANLAHCIDYLNDIEEQLKQVDTPAYCVVVHRDKQDGPDDWRQFTYTVQPGDRCNDALYQNRNIRGSAILAFWESIATHYPDTTGDDIYERFEIIGFAFIKGVYDWEFDA